MNAAMKSFFFLALVTSVLANVFQAMAARSQASLKNEGSRPVASASTTDFDGKVDWHLKHVGDGEDLIQIIDHTRSIACYGKMNTGGAATVSCQKFAGN